MVIRCTAGGCCHAVSSSLNQTADVWSCGVMLYVMLVGAYPFERPEDKHDNQKLQKMIQVICSIMPDHAHAILIIMHVASQKHPGEYSR
jgi:serine/threonine protein kinase